jgi:hypothetical protein
MGSNTMTSEFNDNQIRLMEVEGGAVVPRS